MGTCPRVVREGIRGSRSRIALAGSRPAALPRARRRPGSRTPRALRRSARPHGRRARLCVSVSAAAPRRLIPVRRSAPCSTPHAVHGTDGPRRIDAYRIGLQPFSFVLTGIGPGGRPLRSLRLAPPPINLGEVESAGALRLRRPVADRMEHAGSTRPLVVRLLSARGRDRGFFKQGIWRCGRASARADHPPDRDQ